MNKQYIPNNYELIDTSDLINSNLNDLKFYGDQNKLIALCHSEKTKNPIWHYKFKNIDHMLNKIKSTIDERIEHKQKIVERKENRKLPHTFKIGDYVSCSWGYDQTNIYFYMITEVVSDSSVRLARVRGQIFKSEETHDLIVPTTEIIGETKLKKVGRNTLNEYIKFSSFMYGFKWDGKPKYKTNPLYGH